MSARSQKTPLSAAWQRYAHLRVSRARQIGLLSFVPEKTLCVDCGKPAAMHDHRDYARPLSVVPVCRRCNALRGPAAHPQCMPPRIPRPSTWAEMFAGDMLYSERPYHALIATAEALSVDGYSYEFEPMSNGYLVKCVKSPLVTTQDGYDLLMETPP